MKTYDDVTGSS